MRYHVMKAVETLVPMGFNPEVIDLISLKPLDMEAIGESVKKTHRVLIVEEGMKSGAIGSELSSRIMEELFDELDAPVKRLASQDIPTPYNGVLENATIVQPEDVVAAVEEMLTAVAV